MDRSALLETIRVKFLEAFVLAAEQSLASVRKLAGQPAMTEALCALTQREPELCGALQLHMEKLLNRSFQTAYSKFLPALAKDTGGNKLTLIDFTQPENQALIEEITAGFRHAAEHPLRDLNIRMALLFNQPVIKENENPCRPWLFTQCIVGTIEALGERAELTAVLCQHIAAKLIDHVVSIYDAINSYLVENGVATHLSLKREAVAPRKKAASPAQPAPNLHTGARQSLEERQISASLLEALQGLAKSQTPVLQTLAHPLIHPFSASLNNQIRTHYDQLMEAAQSSDERGVIDTIATLLDFILADINTDYTVRLQLAKLQLPLLQTALKEAGFFSNSTHPARLFINHIGNLPLNTRGAQVTPEAAPISTKIEQAINTRLESKNSLAGPTVLFPQLLTELDRLIADSFVEGASQQAHSARVCEAAQRRLPQFVTLCEQLNTALLSLKVDPFLHSFLTHTWTLVIDQAQRQNDATTTASHRLRELVPDLLWSILPHHHREDRARLLALLPALTQSIREGLATIGIEAKHEQAIFDWLMQAHRGLLRNNTLASKPPSIEAVREHFQTFISADADFEVADAISTPYPIKYRHYLDRIIHQVDIDFSCQNSLDGAAPKPLRYAQRLPLFERAMEARAECQTAPMASNPTTRLTR